MRIYSFGVTLTICFFLFLWMLHKLSKRFDYDSKFLTNNIVWYMISTFIFSRLFYIISKWNDLKYIRNSFDFFIMNDYHFSLFGAMVGFLIVLIINIKLKKEKLIQYIDGVVLSFLFILSLGFIGAFLGGQVYGRETLLGIEIMYTHPFTSVPFQVPIFPLPIVYSILFFILFSLLYILSVFIKIKGFLGYIGLIAFGSILLIFECFSGKYDILKDATSVNFPQIFSIILILTASYQLAKILKEKSTQAVPVQKKPKEKKNDIKK